MQGRTILVIDDNDAVRTALDVLLTLEGARVETAATPQAGIERVARGGVDLVLQDMNFRREATSGAEGIELFHAHARHGPAAAGRAADGVDQPRDRGRAGQGRAPPTTSRSRGTTRGW